MLVINLNCLRIRLIRLLVILNEYVFRAQSKVNKLCTPKDGLLLDNYALFVITVLFGDNFQVSDLLIALRQLLELDLDP